MTTLWWRGIGRATERISCEEESRDSGPRAILAETISSVEEAAELAGDRSLRVRTEGAVHGSCSGDRQTKIRQLAHKHYRQLVAEVGAPRPESRSSRRPRERGWRPHAAPALWRAQSWRDNLRDAPGHWGSQRATAGARVLGIARGSPFVDGRRRA